MNYNDEIKQEFLNETKAELQKELELESLSELSDDALESITGGLTMDESDTQSTSHLEEKLFSF